MNAASSPFCCGCADCETWRRVRGIARMTLAEFQQTRELDLEQMDAPEKPAVAADGEKA